MKRLADLVVKVFADGADRAGVLRAYRHPLVKGFTTCPGRLRQAGVADYEAFARQLVRDVPDRPVSFAVLSDDFDEMQGQARRIASWGPNVYVSVPVSNTRGECAAPLLAALAGAGVKLNVTAVLTLRQVSAVCAAVGGRAAALVSVSAGRLADAGVDPVPVLTAARALVDGHRNVELLWADPREVLNVFQADAAGCHVIGVGDDLLKKLDSAGKDPEALSLEAVRMFRSDAIAAGFRLGGAGPGRHAA